LFHLRLLYKSDFNKLFGACLHVNKLIQLGNAGFFDCPSNAMLTFQHYMLFSELINENNGRMLHHHIAFLFGLIVRDDIQEVYVSMNEYESLNIVPHSREYSLSFGDSFPISTITSMPASTTSSCTSTTTSAPFNVVAPAPKSVLT